jgi:iron complex outermembrane receptor protein
MLKVGKYVAAAGLASALSSAATAQSQIETSAGLTPVTTTADNQPASTTSASTSAGVASAGQKKGQRGSGVEEIVVKSKRLTSTEAAATALKAIPGGVTLLSAADVSQQHLTTLGDLLDSVPGVFIEANGNTGAPKISIRGSAVNDGHLFFRTGIQYLFDGLPITGLSGTPFEQWNPQDLADTEVLRGPAGLDFGAEELGGAVNFITHTGYNSPEYLARFDAGSFGYWGGQLSSGKVIGPYDYYISYSGFEAQNFQHDSASNAMRIAADFGYQITPAIDTRFYFRFADAFEQECWGISKAEIKADPSSCSPLNLIDKSRRSNPDSIWVANKTNITFEDNSSLSIGVDYNHYPISGPGILFGSTNWQFDDVSLVLHYKRTDTLFDRPSITSVNLLTTTAVNSVLYAYPGARSLALAFSNLAAGSRFTGSSDVNLDISNDYEIVPRLWLTNAIDGVFTNRVNDYFKYPVPGILPQQDRAVTDFQGRVGARYDVLPSVQIYGTVGRTVEPERAFDPIQFGGGYTTISQLKAET